MADDDDQEFDELYGRKTENVDGDGGSENVTAGSETNAPQDDIQRTGTEVPTTDDGENVVPAEGESAEGGSGEQGEGEEDEEEEESDDDIDIVLEEKGKEAPSRPLPPVSGKNLSIRNPISIGKAPTKGKPLLPTPTQPLQNKESIINFNLEDLEDKPWRKPGADLTDYFNYGFTEESWKVYCTKQVQLRLEQNMQTKISVWEGQKASDLPPELMMMQDKRRGGSTRSGSSSSGGSSSGSQRRSGGDDFRRRTRDQDDSGMGESGDFSPGREDEGYNDRMDSRDRPFLPPGMVPFPPGGFPPGMMPPFPPGSFPPGMRPPFPLGGPMGQLPPGGGSRGSDFPSGSRGGRSDGGRERDRYDERDRESHRGSDWERRSGSSREESGSGSERRRERDDRSTSADRPSDRSSSERSRLDERGADYDRERRSGSGSSSSSSSSKDERRSSSSLSSSSRDRDSTSRERDSTSSSSSSRRSGSGSSTSGGSSSREDSKRKSSSSSSSSSREEDDRSSKRRR